MLRYFSICLLLFLICGKTCVFLKNKAHFLKTVIEGIFKQYETLDKEAFSRSPAARFLLLAQIYRADASQSINHSSSTTLPAVDFKIKF